MDDIRAQPARLSQQFGIRRGIGRCVAAQIPTSAADFGTRTHSALAHVLEQFVSGSFSVGLLQSPPERFHGRLHFSVAVARTDEADAVAWTVDGLHGKPSIALVLAIGRCNLS